jgi:hypothetical protein
MAITRPAQDAAVKDINTDDELLRVLEDVCGHTKEEAQDILEELGRNPKYGPYSRSIDEGTLTQNGF